MLGNPSSYAGKKRKKPVPKQKRVSDGNEVKSNPSKRHRDRLNGELDRLTDLLPFSEDIRSRLDKLSVLRLSVGYLRVKNYFSASMPNSKSSPVFPGEDRQNGNNTTGLSEGELLLQALNGFVMMVTSEGLVFYVSPTIKNYLGFHQSDVVHQSVFELIHTDDRAMFRQQLHFALNPPTGVDGEVLQSNAVAYSSEQLPPENSSFLERNFVCRFRCLLDNCSGFLALKFQGRLKYLHGQTCLTDNGTCNKPQLAMFAIAMPVNPPSIVEIRAKILLFQTKHKLDFTPMGVDSRGKVILGYSETELCMKGSGYQFIHAADMMYCANKHIRMIKKGETGMTVFRLLSKSSGWVWVKANAKLIFKGGRPEFIIAYQRALDNSEGEEYLRQRRLELPFSFTTGEAILYDTGPSVDISEFQFNKMFNKNHTPKDVTPGSLVDSFLKQDDTVYNQTVNPSLPVDQVFLESRALVSIPSDAWQESGATPPPGARVGVEVESQRSVMTVIDKLAKSSNFCSVLQNLDVSDAELAELENVINGLSSGEGRQNGVSAELDSILSNDIFDYIETVLFKEKEDNGLNGSSPCCLSSVINHQLDPFSQAARLATTGLCEPARTLSQDCTYAPVNGLYAHQQQDMTNGPAITGQSLAAQMFSNTQKLPHHSCPIAQADANLPPLQHLQLQDIFTPYIELPQIMVPDAPSDDGSAMFQPCVQTRLDCQTQSSQLLLHPLSNLQTPAVATNGQLLQRSVKQPSNVIIKDILPPLPCSHVNPSRTPNIPIPFTATSLQRNPQLETHTHQVQQWPQSQQQMLPHAGVTQNGPELAPACHSQTSDSQTFPLAGLSPGGAPALDHIQQGGLACGQAVTRSSCMFNQHFSYHPAGGDVMALSRSSGLRGAEMTLDQSPLQGSCYFQWSHSEPEVGTSAVNQENISPLAAPSITTSSEHIFNSQHYLEHNKHK